MMLNIQKIQNIESTYTTNEEIKNLLDRENKTISAAISKQPKHRDPRYNDELMGNLIVCANDDNVYYRYFIEDYTTVNYSQLKWDQVRLVQIDKEDCKGRIGKNIEANGLHYPPFVYITVEEDKKNNTKAQYRISTGHNRCWTIGCYLKKQIPVFIRSRQYKITVNHDDKSLKLEKINNSLYSGISKIRANKPASSRQYTMEDAKLHLDDLWKIDSTFDGLLDGSKKPDRDEFDLIMDLVYGSDGYFNTSGPRTKIHKRFVNGSSTSRFIDISTAGEIDSYLSRNKYNIGRSENSKHRLKTGSHLCSTNQAIVLIADSNGRHLEEKIMLLLEKEKITEDWSIPKNKNNQNFNIHAFGRIYKPSADLAELKSARNTFKTRCETMNKFLESCNSELRISKLIFPKQLTDAVDEDRIDDLTEVDNSKDSEVLQFNSL
jgi:hypothetical protein